jgi:hypothetical protein
MDILPRSVLYYGFNEDESCVLIGTEKGFIVFDAFPFVERFHRGLSYLCTFFSLSFSMISLEWGNQNS